MAISKAKPQYHVPLLFLSVFILLSSKVESKDSVYFNFPNFNSDDDISFLGDASLSNGTLKLTLTDEHDIPYANASAGRAVYAKPVRIRVNGTDRVASFITSFTFLIKPPPAKYHAKQAEGLTFFIAPTDFGIPNYSGGKYFTLFNDTTAFRPSLNKVVAVEFDTKVSYEVKDPLYPHIGIDVNTIVSAVTERWNESSSGLKARATIKYLASSKILSVRLSYPDTGKTYPKLEHKVDFSTFPETVKFGFSAATGLGAETHNIFSWRFYSVLKNINIGAEEEESYGSPAHSAV